MRLHHAAAVAALLLPGPAASQQTFRSGIDLVRVDALVTDGGKPIAGLTAADFDLRDNGVVQTATVETIASLPVSLVLALDTSASVAGMRLVNLRRGVDLIISGLRAGDQAALLTFSHRVRLQTPLTSDFSSIPTLMARADVSGGTSLHDATYAALALTDRPEARSLLLVFSDGLDTTSWMSAAEVQRIAARANAVVYGITVAASDVSGVGMFGSGPRYTKGQTDFLDAVAGASGGRVLKADATVKLPAAFGEILREFRTRCVLSYSPRGVDTPGWHRIDLRVKGRRADVKARAGYQK